MSLISAVAGAFKSDKEKLAECREQLAYAKHRCGELERIINKSINTDPRDFKEAKQRCKISENNLADAMELIDKLTIENRDLKSPPRMRGSPSCLGG